MSQQSNDQSMKIRLLWNVADPDDPYDIRKSMISRLPQHTQNFMGSNLQIVCLMQAAEIQRLNVYLSQFKSKYRELERVELDRHSYEIQIKQLAEKARQGEKFKIENEKLKQYIKKLSLELQDLHKRPNISPSLQAQHQELRRRYQSLLIELRNARQAIGSHNITINKLTQENLELRMKYDKLDKQRLTDLAQQRQKYQAKIRERIQIQIRQVQTRLNGRISQLQSDCRLYKQQLQSKNHQISSLLSKNQLLRKELQKTKSTGNSELTNKISQLQVINQQLSRKASQLQYIFQQYTRIENKLKQAQNVERRSQQQKRFLKEEITRLKSAHQRQIQNYNTTIQEQQNKIALLSSEIERLSYMSSTNKNEIDKKYNEMCDNYQIKIRHIIQDYELKLIRVKQNRTEIETLQLQIRSLKASNQEIRSKNQSLLNEITLLSRRLAEIQGENQRLKSMFALKQDQIRNLERNNENLNMENMSLRKALMQKDRIASSIQSQRINYETKIRQLIGQVKKKQQLLKQLQNEVYKNHKLIQNYERARSQVLQNQQYIQRLKKQLNQSKRRAQQYEIDLKNGTIIPVGILNEQLRRNTEQITIKIRMEEQLQIRKYIEQKTILQKQVTKLVQQNRHLQQQLIKIQQKLKIRDHDGRQNLAIIQTRYVTQITDLSNSIKALRQQNDRSNIDKNRMKSALNQTEKVISLKQREYGDNLRETNRKMDQIKVTNQQLRTEIARLKQQLNMSQDGNQRLQRQIQEKLIKIYNSQLQQKDNIISTLQRQVKAARQEIKSLQSTYENSNATIKNYKQRLLNLSQEIQRLTELLKRKGDELEQFRRQAGYNKNKDEQINRLKIQMREVEQKYSRIIQIKEQQTRSIRVKVQNIESIETNYKRQMKQREDEIKGLKGQAQNIQQVYKRQLRDKQQQLSRFKIKISKFDETIQVSIKQKDQQINRLNRQINKINQNCGRQLRDKDEEINRLSVEVSNVQQLIRNKLRQKDDQINKINNNMNNNNENYRKQMREKEDELDRLKAELNNSDQSIRGKLREKQQQINRLKAQIGNISSEYENVKRQFRGRDDEIKTLNNKNIQIQTYYRKLLSQKQQQNRGLLERISRIEQDKDRKQRDIQAEYENRIKLIIQNETNSLKNEIANLKKKNQLLGIQMIEVRRQSQSKLMLIKSMQSEMTALKKQRQNHLQMISQLQSSVEQINIRIRTNNDGLDRKCHQQEIQIINLKKYIEQFEITLNHTIEQRDHLFNISHEYQDEIAKLKQQLGNNSKSQANYIQIQKQYGDLTIICREYQQKISRYEAQFISMDNKIREYQRNLNQAINEITRLSGLLKDRDGQINIIAELRQQLNLLTLNLTNATQSSREWEHKYIQLYNTYNNQAELHRNKMLDHQKKVGMLQQQFQQLNSLISTLKQQNTYLRQQTSQSNDLIEKNKHLSAEIDRLIYQLEITKKQLTDTRLVLIDQMALERRLQENLSLFVILFAEIQTLRKRVVDTEKQCQNVRRTSLTPHRIDRQVGRSLQSRTSEVVTRIIRKQ